MKEDVLKVNGMHDGAPPIIFHNAAILRSKMTETESLLWDKLKDKSFGFKFRRQHPINRYILDFYCHKKRLSIEIDGGYHFSKEQKEKDYERTKYLKSVGISEMRFTNSDVKSNIKEVFEKIKLEIETNPF